MGSAVGTALGVVGAAVGAAVGWLDGAHVASVCVVTVSDSRSAEITRNSCGSNDISDSFGRERASPLLPAEARRAPASAVATE